jgi:hypothetical protein
MSIHCLQNVSQVSIIVPEFTQGAATQQGIKPREEGGGGEQYTLVPHRVTQAEAAVHEGALQYSSS